MAWKPKCQQPSIASISQTLISKNQLLHSNRWINMFYKCIWLINICRLIVNFILFVIWGEKKSQACMDSGFFYVINHAISKEFMDEVFAQSKKFFELPFDEKMKLWVERNRGYKQPLKNQFFDQETNQQGQQRFQSRHFSLTVFKF